MRLPSEFTILSQRVKVEMSDTLMQDHGAVGMCRFQENKIILQRPSLAAQINRDQVELTFFHELVHYLLMSIGEDDLNSNERFVDLMGNLFLQFLKTAKSRKES